MGKSIPKAYRKEERIMVRITSEEKEKLERILEIQDKAVADILRNFIKDYIRAYEILIEKGGNQDEKK
ncbi:MAG: hypothetical protein ACYCSB_04775 [bacterium]